MTRDEGHALDTENCLTAILSEQDLVGVLGRDFAVNIVEIGRTGCLFESASDVAPGTFGMVRVTIDGAEYQDAIRVTRSTPLLGAGARYQLGAEFVWLAAPGPHSLRRLASRISADGGELETAEAAEA